MAYADALGYSHADHVIFSLDEPSQTAAPVVVETPKEASPCEPAVVPQERTAARAAPYQETSVAATVERVTLSTNSAETQGEHDTDWIFRLQVHLQ